MESHAALCTNISAEFCVFQVSANAMLAMKQKASLPRSRITALRTVQCDITAVRTDPCYIRGLMCRTLGTSGDKLQNPSPPFVTIFLAPFWVSIVTREVVTTAARHRSRRSLLSVTVSQISTELGSAGQGFPRNR